MLFWDDIQAAERLINFVDILRSEERTIIDVAINHIYGITQGDPLAMPMYAFAKIPLIFHLTGCVTRLPIPSHEHDFALHKSAFQDTAVALCYGWLPVNTLAHCACGSSFSVEHALSCLKGRLLSIR